MISAERQELSRGAVLLVNHQWVHSRFARVNCVFTVVKTTWFSCVEPGLGDTAGDAGISSPPSLASLFLASSIGTDSSSPLGSWEASFVSVSVVLLKPLESCSYAYDWVSQAARLKMIHHKLRPRKNIFPSSLCLSWCMSSTPQFVCLLYPLNDTQLCCCPSEWGYDFHPKGNPSHYHFWQIADLPSLSATQLLIL